MFHKYRDTHELVVDYAEALRDGCIPTFLKSLSRFEGSHAMTVPSFWEAADMVRTINDIGFAEHMISPNLDLFIVRVHAKIASRARRARAPGVVATRKASHQNVRGQAYS